MDPCHSKKKKKVSTTNNIKNNYDDPVIVSLLPLFDNLNLDKLNIDSNEIDITLFDNVTPSSLSLFLNNNFGFNFSPSLFESIPHQQLQSMFDNTKLSLYLKRKLEKPKHRYSLSYFVQDNYFKNNNINNINNINKQNEIDDEEIDDGDHDEEKKISIDLDKLCISPKVSIKSRSKTFNVSSSLQSSSKPPQNNLSLLRNILKGIKGVMTTRSNNITMIKDCDLKNECLHSIKLKEANGEFEFESFAPSIFEILRKQFNLKGFKYLYKLLGINNNGYKKNSVDIEYSCKYFWKALITNSKSGLPFYRSRDNMFIIKALKYDEWLFLRQSFLSNYYKHIQNNNDSLLAKILGIYRINDIYIMIMKNVHHSIKSSIIMHKIYDLKGSTHKRQATRHKFLLDKNDFTAMNSIDIISSLDQLNESDDESNEEKEEKEETIDNIKHRYSPSWYTPTKKDRDSAKIKIIKSDTLKSPKKKRNAFTFDASYDENIGSYNNTNNNETLQTLSRSSTKSVEVWKRSKILKDLDWIQDKQIIKIGKIRSSFFLGQLDKDLKFLIEQNVMDYSLLVGMNFRKEINFESNDDRWTISKLFTYEMGGMCYDRSEEENDNINTIKHKKKYIPQKDAIYFVGIIDFLQVYSPRKRMETLIKGITNDKNTISSIDPKSYAKRLYSFIERSVE